MRCAGTPDHCRALPKVTSPRIANALIEGIPSVMTLLTAPLIFEGNWHKSPLDEATQVISIMREECLRGVRLLSDRQPQKLQVFSHLTGGPHVRLTDNMIARVVIDGGYRDWCRMAYQFGHELGHVMCNSWQLEALPIRPTQWLEECLAEAFSLRGLALLADRWEQDPPLSDDKDYSKYLRRYREAVITPYRKGGRPAGPALDTWFSVNRTAVENGIGGRAGMGPVMLMILGELDRDKGCVEDLGALNRWRARAAAPLEEYLRLWQHSCADLGTPGRLPMRVKELLFFNAEPLSRHPPQPNVRTPRRNQVYEQVVAIDELLPWEHPVRLVWGFIEALDRIENKNRMPTVLENTRLPKQAPIDLRLLRALWLWATIEGIGSTAHIARLCQERLSYRWLCGGVAIDRETIREFRVAHAGALDRLLAHALAAIAKEALVPIPPLSGGPEKAGPVAGAASATKRRGLQALAAAAAARVRELMGELDKDNPIADEQQRRAKKRCLIKTQSARISAALERMHELGWPRRPQQT
jgi:transposase